MAFSATSIITQDFSPGNQPAQDIQNLLAECQPHLQPPNFEECRRILETFKLAREGFFIEVGANDPRQNSLTYILERLGWTGMLVSPLILGIDFSV